MQIKNKFILLFIGLQLLLFQQIIAQSYYFRNYSAEDGLPFVYVSTIFQDDKGNLWSGGYGGLSKFDGHSFTNYSPKDGLLNHSVTCINQDNQGNVWIGTISGVNKFDGKNFTNYTSKHGLISDSISACIKDKTGNLWFGTNKGISKLTGGSFINFSTKDGMISNSVKCLYVDVTGKIWIGTDMGITVFNGTSFTNYLLADGLPNNTINSITQDRQQNIWIATSAGLCKYANNKFTTLAQQQGLMDVDIQTVITDYKNRVWLGTATGLISYYDNRFQKYPIKLGPNSNRINCLFEDYENNIWLGTRSGLFKYRGTPFISYGPKDGLSNGFMTSVMRDSKDTLWAGSQEGLLYKFVNDTFISYGSQNGLKAKIIQNIYEYSPDSLWLATDKGLTIFNRKKFIKKEDPTNIFTKSINSFYKDSKNNIWIGGKGCIYKYDGDHFTSYTFKTKNKNFIATCFVEDTTGILWIGTHLGGLIKYDRDKFVECSEKLGLKSDSFLQALIDSEGNLYFGTLDGLWMMNPYNSKIKPTRFTQEDGMSSDLIYSLTFSKTQNEMWIGTNQGVNKLNVAEYKKIGQKKIIPFGKQEGFLGVECNEGHFLEKDGSIWFATVKGLIKYDPKGYIENKTEARISITDFFLSYTDTVLLNNAHLKYNDNNITFAYSGICLTNPDKVLYSYILEGFQKDWSLPSKERSVTYFNLPPGSYTFNVISSNNEGIWNKVPASYSFTIDRPFWKTWLFIISSASFLLIAAVFSTLYRIRQIKMREKNKTELNKRIANIESQALRAQMNPHFIFNTLSSIQHYISNNDTNAALKYLSKFAKLMRRIMDNSKLQMIPVAEEISALNLYLELEVMRFENKFQYLITVDATVDQNYDRIPSMLIQPYVENAIIHGLLPKKESGKITITLHRQGDTILCTIEDDGIGRKKAEEFKKNRVQQHKSMGMSITQERLDVLNSSLNSNLYVEITDIYKNGKTAGTKVQLVIPIEIEDN
jgi:ligand-binding sensor domain-containing protein